jgi:hypothetical protein
MYLVEADLRPIRGISVYDRVQLFVVLAREGDTGSRPKASLIPARRNRWSQTLCILGTNNRTEKEYFGDLTVR